MLSNMKILLKNKCDDRKSRVLDIEAAVESMLSVTRHQAARQAEKGRLVVRLRSVVRRGV